MIVEAAETILARSLLAAIAVLTFFLPWLWLKSSSPEKKVVEVPVQVGGTSTHPSSSLSSSSTHRGGGAKKAEAWDAAYVADAGVPADDQEGVLQMSRAIECCARGVTEPLCDPLTILRFYNSREKVVADAVAMYRETIAWREKFGIARIMNEFGDGPVYDEIPGRGHSRLVETTGNSTTTVGNERDPCAWTYRRLPKTPRAKLAQRIIFAGILDEKDNPTEGAPVSVWRLGLFDLPGVGREEGMLQLMTEAFVSHLEEFLQAGRAASLQRKRLVRGRLVIDGTGLGLGNIRTMHITKKITGLGKAYFPETTASATIVRAPWVFAKVYGMVKPLLTPLQRSKVCVLTGQDLSAAGGGGSDEESEFSQHSTLKISQLPQFLGGTTSDSQCPEPMQVPVNALASLDSQ